MKPALTPAMIRELEDIKADNDGRLDTVDVVEKAKQLSSALHYHPAFEWDIGKAAETAWAQAARGIIQMYVTFIDLGRGVREDIRGVISLVDPADGKRHGEDTARVLREDRPALVETVLDRLLGHLRNYPLPEFEPLLVLIEQIRQDARRPPPRGRRRRLPGEGPRPRP